MPDLTLQAILGTDKNNQCFSVFKSTADPAKLEVYFGMALLVKRQLEFSTDDNYFSAKKSVYIGLLL